MNALGIPGDKLYVETNHLQIVDGDLLMVCSDGLPDMLPDTDILDILSAHPQLQDACDALLEKALDRGGKDNITLCMGRFYVGPLTTTE
jgi:serine/threonine protein phosphatase PrpC